VVVLELRVKPGASDASCIREAFKQLSSVIDQLSHSRKRVTPFAEQMTSGKVQVFTSGDQVFTSGDQVFTFGDQVFTFGDQVFTSGDQVTPANVGLFDLLCRSVRKFRLPILNSMRRVVISTRGIQNFRRLKREER